MQKTCFKYFVCLFLVSLLFFSFIPFCSAQNQLRMPKDANDAKNLLYSYLKTVWDKAYYYLDKEVEKRKPSVQQEFNKEVNELKTEAVKEAPSLWQRFLDLIH